MNLDKEAVWQLLLGGLAFYITLRLVMLALGVLGGAILAGVG